jgi:hypothetical protein
LLGRGNSALFDLLLTREECGLFGGEAGVLRNVQMPMVVASVLNTITATLHGLVHPTSRRNLLTHVGFPAVRLTG